MPGGVVKYIVSQHPDAKDISEYLTPEKIGSCNPEESQESSADEVREHKLGQEAEGK